MTSLAGHFLVARPLLHDPSFAQTVVLILRHKRPDLPRPYRTFGYPLLPLAFVLVYVWFLGQVFAERPFESLMGLVLIGLGAPVYFLWQRFAGGEGAASSAAP